MLRFVIYFYKEILLLCILTALKLKDFGQSVTAVKRIRCVLFDQFTQAKVLILRLISWLNRLQTRYLYFIYHANTCSEGFVRRHYSNDFSNDISICLPYAEFWFWWLLKLKYAEFWFWWILGNMSLLSVWKRKKI